MKVFGGFIDGKLDWRMMDDGFGGEHLRMVPVLFRTRKEARTQYEDVRRIEIKLDQ